MAVNSIISRFLKYISTIFTIILVSILIKYILIYIGFLPIISPISGSSMQPTLFDKQRLSIYLFNNFSSKIHNLKHGDLVAFSNEKTEGDEYIKRIIGLPGDTINISNGYVLVNNNNILEPYVLKPRSTFGGDFAAECKQLIVPQNSVFVLGDNRKRSLDSRDIGFINIYSIHQFLPFKKQNNISQKWRDTSNDFIDSNYSIFNTKQYYLELNNYRKENQKNELKIDSRLEKLAYIRAEKLLDQYQKVIDKKSSDIEYQNDISFVGYSNIINQEISTYGFYEAGELMAYWKEKKTDNTLLNSEFTDTGIASIIKKIDGCEIQIVVQEFGGYKPPEYKESDYLDIKKAIDSLRDALPSWLEISSKNNKFYNENKSEIDRIIFLTNQRITYLNSIYDTMNQNKWLSNQQQQYIRLNTQYQEEQESIVSKLNDKIKRENSH